MTKRTLLPLLMLCGTLAVPVPGAADPWKDESAHGHRGGPPPWAPAHGERRKHEKHQRHHHRESVVEVRVPSGPIVIENGRCNRETVGAVLGGIVGGILGNQVGHDKGNPEAGTITGAVLGVLVGKSIGRSMDNRDAGCAVHALDQARDGQSIRWRNAESGIDFRLTPTATFRREGRICRSYRVEAADRGDTRERAAEACRLSDGKWAFRG